MQQNKSEDSMLSNEIFPGPITDLEAKAIFDRQPLISNSFGGNN
jgi:hypothetical protein